MATISRSFLYLYHPLSLHEMKMTGSARFHLRLCLLRVEWIDLGIRQHVGKDEIPMLDHSVIHVLCMHIKDKLTSTPGYAEDCQLHRSF